MADVHGNINELSSNGVSPSGKAQDSDSCTAGSNPATPVFGCVAQVVEHLTFNQVVRGSNPRTLTVKAVVLMTIIGTVAFFLLFYCAGKFLYCIFDTKPGLLCCKNAACYRMEPITDSRI